MNNTTTTTKISPNLIRNPGAESGFDHWIQVGDAPVLIDFNGSFHLGYYPHSANHCFVGGYTKVGLQSILRQSIELLRVPLNLTKEQIDSGELQVTISFYYQTWFPSNGTADDVEVDVVFLTTSSIVIGRVRTGKLICRQSQLDWCYYMDSYPLPSTTRLIYYMMIFSKNDELDPSIDVYMDDHSLKIL